VIYAIFVPVSLLRDGILNKSACCFKLGKTSTEIYSMLKVAFGEDNSNIRVVFESSKVE
jgi:hypothetical protein